MNNIESSHEMTEYRQYIVVDSQILILIIHIKGLLRKNGNAEILKRTGANIYCQLQVSADRVSHFLDAEYSQVQSLSKQTLMYLNLTFMN